MTIIKITIKIHIECNYTKGENMNHTLVDMFYNKEADKLSNAFDKSIQDNKKYTEEIKDLLPNEKKINRPLLLWNIKFF